MNVDEIQDFVAQFDANWVLDVFKEELGLSIPVREKKPRFVEYKYTVWKERNLPEEKKTFPSKTKVLTSFRVFQRAHAEANGIIDRTFLFRLYSHRDRREDVDPTHISIPHLFVSVESFVGIVEDGFWGIRESGEVFLKTFDSIQKFIRSLVTELNEDPNAPKWVVWEHNDPRVLGDYYGEVNRIVTYIGSKRHAFELYETRRRMSRFAGTRSCYVGYPHEIKPGEKLAVGDKVVIHRGREHISHEEMWEIQHGY